MEITYAENTKGNRGLQVDNKDLDLSKPSEVVEALRAAHQEGARGAAFVVTNDAPAEQPEEASDNQSSEAADNTSDDVSGSTMPKEDSLSNAPEAAGANLPGGNDEQVQ